jgi:hypothetical protein
MGYGLWARWANLAGNGVGYGQNVWVIRSYGVPVVWVIRELTVYIKCGKDVFFSQSERLKLHVPSPYGGWQNVRGILIGITR